MKFVGHLDTMRYFQKALRRAELPVAFSGGYSPHMIMSFAVPLGVGMESLGDYFDLEMAEDMSTAEIAARLDEQMAEGMHIVSVRKVEDGKAGKAMALVAAADYLVEFRAGTTGLRHYCCNGGCCLCLADGTASSSEACGFPASGAFVSTEDPVPASGKLLRGIRLFSHVQQPCPTSRSCRLHRRTVQHLPAGAC